jgi:hypothetical protein
MNVLSHIVDAKTYPSDGMAELVSYVRDVVDFRFGMQNKPMRDDLVSETLAVLMRRWDQSNFKRNKTAVRYAVLTARNRLGLGNASSKRSNLFWNRNVVFETATIKVGEDGDTSTILDRTSAPEPSREIAQRALVELSARLTGKDLAIFRMMIRGDSHKEIAKRFKVTAMMARNYTAEIIAALRKSVREEYDNAQHIINDLSARRGLGQINTQIMDDPDGPKKRTRQGRPANRPERRIRRWSKVKIARHTPCHAPEVVRTQRDFNRPRIRLEGRTGLAALRNLGLMRKSP